MIKFNLERPLKGTVCIYRTESMIIKKVSKTLLRQKIEEMKFENKEIQEDLKVMDGLLMDIKFITLSSNSSKEIKFFLDLTDYGAKIQSFTITGNYPLYNLLRKMTK